MFNLDLKGRGGSLLVIEHYYRAYLAGAVMYWALGSMDAASTAPTGKAAF